MNHKQLVSQIDQMKAEMDNYHNELSKLRQQLSSYEDVEAEVMPVKSSRTSRRNLLKQLGVGVAGLSAIVAAGALNSNMVSAANPVNADNAIDATSGPTGYAVAASSAFAPLYLDPQGTLPTGAGHRTGEVFVDSTGKIYFNVAGGATSTWRQLAGTDTAGSYHSLPNPTRFVDTRVPVGTATVGGNGQYTANSDRTYQLTGVTISGVTLPAGTTAIVGNITVVSPTSASGFPFLTLWPSGTRPAASNLNFVNGQTLNNAFTVALASDGTLKVFSNATTHIVIDVAGYYI